MLEQHSYGHFACMRASSCVSRSLLPCERVLELPFCEDVNETDDIALPKVYLKIPPAANSRSRRAPILTCYIAKQSALILGPT